MVPTSGTALFRRGLFDNLSPRGVASGIDALLPSVLDMAFNGEL